MQVIQWFCLPQLTVVEDWKQFSKGVKEDSSISCLTTLSQLELALEIRKPDLESQKAMETI